MSSGGKSNGPWLAALKASLPASGSFSIGEIRNMNKLLLAAVLAIGMGTSLMAAEGESAVVTLKGVLQQDKNGFFIKIDGTFYDISIGDESKADMQKFYTGLEGDMVAVTGALHVQDVPNGKPYITVYSNDITRLKGVRVVRTTTEPETVIVREHYVERPRGIHLPGVHINW
jgi:hypothetical protein